MARLRACERVTAMPEGSTEVACKMPSYSVPFLVTTLTSQPYIHTHQNDPITILSR